VDSMQCPGCGAAVRPKESWCSLCYRDLRPAKPAVSAPAEVAGTAGALIKTNLMDADVLTAELSAAIPRPTAAASDESLPDGERPKTWPCACGEAVPIDADACPTCGRAFLNELRGLDAPHRRGPQWLTTYLQASRGIRLAIAGMIGAAIALGIPGLLALFG
jgi:hypothetical protein